MKRYFCTYFNSNYMMYGLTMFRSLSETHSDFHLFILCLDEPAYQILNDFDSRITAIQLNELEKYDPELLKCKSSRSMVEYFFTLSPCYPLFLFARFPELETLAYLDSDLFFFATSEPLFAELGAKSMLIFEHGYSCDSGKNTALYGRFNVAFQIYRNNDVCKRCLNWWRTQCLNWCFDRPENGKFADQKYLDKFPDILKEELVISEAHPGAALAPWNINRHVYSFRNSSMLVDGESLIFCHYQGYKFISKYFVTWPYWNQQKTPGKVNSFLAEQYYRENLKTLEVYRSILGEKQTFPAFRTSKLKYMEWLFSWIPIEPLSQLLKALYMMLRPSYNVMYQRKNKRR